MTQKPTTTAKFSWDDLPVEEQMRITAEVKEAMISHLRSTLDIRQAQNDLVAAGVELLQDQLGRVEASAQFNAFCCCLEGHVGSKAKLLEAFQAGKRIEVTIQ